MTFEQSFKKLFSNILKEKFTNYETLVTNDVNFGLDSKKNKLYAIIRSGALIPMYDYRNIQYYTKSLMVSLFYHINNQQEILSKFEDIVKELNTNSINKIEEEIIDNEGNSTTREYYYRLSLTTPVPALSDSQTLITQAMFTGTVLLFDNIDSNKLPLIKINGHELTDVVTLSNERINAYNSYVVNGVLITKYTISNVDESVNITMLDLNTQTTAYLKNHIDNPTSDLLNIEIDNYKFKAFMNVRVDYTFAGGFPLITLQLIKDGDLIG